MKTKLALMALLSVCSTMPMAYLEEQTDEQEVIIVKSDSDSNDENKEEEQKLKFIRNNLV